MSASQRILVEHRPDSRIPSPLIRNGAGPGRGRWGKRHGLIFCGLVILLACWCGPLPELAQRAFFAHMAMHMGVVAGATALLALGMAGSCYDPVRRFPHLFSPIPASVLELVVVWAWHAPRLHHLARHSEGGLVAEQAMFFGCGLLLWLSAFGGEQGRGGARTANGIVGLLLTSMHMTLLGALLIFAPRPLYRPSAGLDGTHGNGRPAVGRSDHVAGR
jgi:putative membrane protein